MLSIINVALNLSKHKRFFVDSIEYFRMLCKVFVLNSRESLVETFIFTQHNLRTFLALK